MRRAVYIGGFGSGKSSAEHLASALELYYDDVDPFTFSEAMENPDRIRKAVKGTDIITHSAGMLAIADTQPNRIDAFNPPLPAGAMRLLARTGLKTVRMHTPGIGVRSIDDILAVNRYDASAVAELIVHPDANLGRIGIIAHFDAVDAAIAAQESGIITSLTYTEGDEYYQLSEHDEMKAILAGVRVARRPGVHDELVLRPVKTLG